jgi:hypothetical protein
MSSIAGFLKKWFLKKLEKPKLYYEQSVYNNISKLYGVIRPGDVVLVEGRSEMSRLIKLFSNSHWSHVALYVGSSLMENDADKKNFYKSKYGEDAKHMLVEAFSGEGVISSPLRKYKDYNIRICRPYGILDADMHQVIQQVVGKIGTHYDDQNILSIALIALQTVFRPKTKISIKTCLGNCNDFQVICSGMIAQAFQEVSYPIVPAVTPDAPDVVFDDSNPYGGGLMMRHYTQISPKDFDLSPNFEVVKYNLIGVKHFDYKRLWVDRN